MLHDSTRMAEAISRGVVKIPAGRLGERSDNPRLDLIRQRRAAFSKGDLTAQPAARDFAIEPILPMEAVTALVAAGGIGKSTLIVELVAHQILGLPFHAMPVRQGPVVILSKEDTRDDYLRKLYALLRARDYLQGREEELAAGLCFYDLRGTDVLLVEERHGTLRIAKDAYLLADMIHADHPGAVAVYVETVSRFIVGEENNSVMAKVVSAAETISAWTKAAAVLVHHVGKEAARGNSTDQYSGRGGSALADNSRSVITLVNPTDDPAGKLPLDVPRDALTDGRVVVLTHAKSSYGPKADTLYLERQIGAHGPVLNRIRIAEGEADPMTRLVKFVRSTELMPKHPPVSLRYLQKNCAAFGVRYRDVPALLELALQGDRLTKSTITTSRGLAVDVYSAFADTAAPF